MSFAKHVSEAFGFKTDQTLWNVTTGASYVPIVGTISGIFYVVVGIFSVVDGGIQVKKRGWKKADKSGLVTGIVCISRGAITALSLGFAGVCFAPVDIAVSCSRSKKSSSATASTAPSV